MKRQTFLGGAAVIAAGGFVAKLIGALYRIPLTNLIGGHGMGLYQMVYPFYFNNADTAGTNFIDALEIAEIWNMNAVKSGCFQDGCTIGNRNGNFIDCEIYHFLIRPPLNTPNP